MLPTPGSYPFNFLVKYGISAGFNFQKTITELLPAPYQTNCFNYELGNTTVDQSFEECVTMCGITKWRKKCNCLPPKKLLYRKTHLLPDDKFCPAGDPCTVVHVRSVCSDQCKPDCLQERYQVEKVLEAPIQNYYVYDNTSIEAMIARKPVPDEIFRHSAAKTFIDIVSEFGGLVGLWLGYSVITLTEIIYALLRRPAKRIQKRISKKRNAKQLSKSPIPS